MKEISFAPLLLTPTTRYTLEGVSPFPLEGCEIGPGETVIFSGRPEGYYTIRDFWICLHGWPLAEIEIERIQVGKTELLHQGTPIPGYLLEHQGTPVLGALIRAGLSRPAGPGDLIGVGIRNRGVYMIPRVNVAATVTIVEDE